MKIKGLGTRTMFHHGSLGACETHKTGRCQKRKGAPVFHKEKVKDFYDGYTSTLSFRPRG